MKPCKEGETSVFARCKGTLQAAQVDYNDCIQSVKRHVIELIPKYESRSDLARSAGARSKKTIFANVPVSDQAIEQVWADIHAFEHQQQCFQPMPRILKDLWCSIQQAATAEGINISRKFAPEQVWEVIQDAGYPRPMFEAFIQNLSTGRDVFHRDAAILDSHRATRCIGQILVDLHSSKVNDVGAQRFLEDCKALLPEQWHSVLSIDLLKTLDNHERILACGTDGGRLNGGTCGLNVESDQKRKPGARDWHEKFKRTRR